MAAPSLLTQLLQGIRDTNNAYILRRCLEPLFVAESSTVLTPAGLVITGAGGTTAKIGATAFVGTVNGTIVKVAAGTVMPPLTSVNVTNGKFNVYCFYVDSVGAVTVRPGTEGSTLAGVAFPPVPANRSLLGFIIVNPTGVGNFIAGTTPLDDATVIPNAVFVSPSGSFNAALSV